MRYAGPCGTGKSHIAQALGHAAVQSGYDVAFTTHSKLLGHLHEARATGSFERRFATYTRVDLLIVDDYADLRIMPTRSLIRGVPRVIEWTLGGG